MPAQTCNRIDLAREQLETAIAVFIEHQRFAAAIPWPAPLERVLGQALRRKGEQAVLDWKFDAADLVHTVLVSSWCCRGRSGTGNPGQRMRFYGCAGSSVGRRRPSKSWLYSMAVLRSPSRALCTSRACSAMKTLTGTRRCNRIVDVPTQRS